MRLPRAIAATRSLLRSVVSLVRSTRELTCSFANTWAQVGVDCVRRYEQPLGDLAIGEAVGRELSDGEL